MYAKTNMITRFIIILLSALVLISPNLVLAQLVTPNPVLIQSNYFNKGNFDLIVPMASGGLGHFWRNNDDPNLPWNGPTIFGTNVGRVDAVSFIQSNFGTQGNFDLIARVGNHLVHFWRDNDHGQIWQGPFTIPNSFGVSGNPVIIQSNYFNRGNFEVIVPMASGGLGHFWRNNDDPNLTWHGPTIFGTNVGRVNSVSFIQSNFGIQGNFEVIAEVGNHLFHFWRDNDHGQIWQGPFFIS